MIERTMERAPELPNAGIVMSNFDHEIRAQVAERIIRGDVRAGYAGWNFYGIVWFADGKWRCMVKCYEVHQVTFVADTLQEIME